jgi:hypothetical protein
LLPRVRAVLLFLQHEGHPDPILADVPRNTNYWMEITGASESAARGVPEWLRNGQGRWRLGAREPSQMVRKYIQSTPEEKLSVSDFGAAIKKQLWPVGKQSRWARKAWAPRVFLKYSN